MGGALWMAVGSQFMALQASIGRGLGCTRPHVRASSAQDGRPAMGPRGHSVQCCTGPLSQVHARGREAPAFSQVSAPLSQPTFFFSYFLSVSLSTQ